MSVVIPAYNAGQLVTTAIQSALAQTHRDLEVVVVDDGSTDDTLARVRSFGDPVRVLSVPHGGVPRARNHGMRAAAGRFIVFLDADDVLEATLVAQAVELLDRRPDLGFVFCNARLFRDGDPPSAPCIPPEFFAGATSIIVRHPLIEIIGAGYFISSSGLCARREVLLEAGDFDESLWGSEDFEYWSRLYLRRPVGLLAQPLVRIRHHVGSMTRQPVKMTPCMAASRDKVIENCRKSGRDDQISIVRQFARASMLSAVRHAIGDGEQVEARRLLRQYRHELYGFAWIGLMTLSLCPAATLRWAARISHRMSRF
ncbi:MAG TPA: glycosyltransferase [Candidatus Polarisedimenticolia bacterium]|nr:glycosyltransferase [Candidatus Polarisedimenticolia bacterium]